MRDELKDHDGGLRFSLLQAATSPQCFLSLPCSQPGLLIPRHTLKPPEMSPRFPYSDLSVLRKCFPAKDTWSKTG